MSWEHLDSDLLSISARNLLTQSTATQQRITTTNLHFVCDEPGPPDDGVVALLVLHSVVDELVHHGVVVAEILPALVESVMN